ncbi:MAG: hypothetical protein PHG79_02100 [Methanosarcina sp.]|nr:hypothetical protein [Methanosarcina sp.]MDD3874028.1 hypothetical protein [Methanosarcina sp.]
MERILCPASGARIVNAFLISFIEIKALFPRLLKLLKPLGVDHCFIAPRVYNLSEITEAFEALGLSALVLEL